MAATPTALDRKAKREELAELYRGLSDVEGQLNDPILPAPADDDSESSKASTEPSDEELLRYFTEVANDTSIRNITKVKEARKIHSMCCAEQARVVHKFDKDVHDEVRKQLKKEDSLSIDTIRIKSKAIEKALKFLSKNEIEQ